ncbi:uncharacterized protein [Asterias amurensis]|uniref:uncharacterized protein n=1 Tax=Asterias amurensis TaxID=7602 RepID=UPI003AB2B323
MGSLYLCYGSNMLSERLLVNGISSTFVTVAKLNNYRLRFADNPNWPTDALWKGATATIDQSQGDTVWGVLLKIKEVDLQTLDMQENVDKGYFRRLSPITVSSETPQEDFSCFTYQMVDPIFDRKPSPQYVNVIRAGAKQKGLPADYQKYLATIEDNGYAGPLPTFDKIMESVQTYLQGGGLPAFHSMRRMSFLYFAYGSNLLRERLLKANPSAKFVAVAKLMNYKLQFCGRHNWTLSSSRWKGGVGNIAESAGDCVWGVVWKLHESDLESLDDQEGVHLDIYRRLESLKVISFQDEKMMDCVSYQMIDPINMTPSPHYIRVIQAGAKQNNIPADYLRFLDCIEHNGYSGQVKIYDEVMKDAKL